MKAVALALLLLGVVLVSAYTEAEYQKEFTTWMQEHRKAYAAEEFQPRYAIFKSNLDYITAWNAQNSMTTLGLNLMADLTNEEYQQIYLGTKVHAPAKVAATLRQEDVLKATAPAEYNATVDWRTKNIVTPIKNQAQCGSCWSFSTTGSVEGAHAQATGNLVSLSEQNLMDCSQAEGNQGCNGGLMDDAFKYIIKNGGIDTEASYPYKEKVGTCQYTAANSGAKISSYKDIISGNETDLEVNALRQPISVAIDASHIGFQLYRSGVYWSPLCSTTNLDHGVLVVGYGVDTANEHNYWIVKNSWGPTWGLEGYIYMSKDRSNNCGIATAASYPII